MLRHIALSALLLCLVLCHVNGWERKWDHTKDDGWDDENWDKTDEKSEEDGHWDKKDDGWGMKDEHWDKKDDHWGMEDDHWDKKDDHWDMKDGEMKMEDFVDFLWKGVKHGKLEEEHAWHIIDFYKHMKHRDMHEDKESHDEMKAEMDMDMKHKKALKMLSKMLVHDGASDDYSKKEWKELLHHILFSHENRQDPVLDMSQECTMKVIAKFWAPAKEIHLCGTVFTLPEVHEKVTFEEGDEIAAATTRHQPEVHFTGLHGEDVTDGLYTMIWSDRADIFPTDGSFATPFIGWMVVNIPGCDVSKGDVVKEYTSSPVTDKYQIFIYEQHDHIHKDFAIGEYTESDGCRYQHRCHFHQAAFVADYHLQQRAVGHLAVYTDPHSAHEMKMDGLVNDQEQCIFYLDVVLHHEMVYNEIDTEDKHALKKQFHKYTSQFICKEHWEDEHTLYLLKAQFGSLVNKYIMKYSEDILVPNFLEFSYDIGLKYKAEADSVEMCGAWFDLPEVHRKVWLSEDKWFDGDREVLMASEIRNAPMVKLAERELTNPPPGHHVDLKDELFTLIIADRTDFGEKFSFVARPNTPYINWMVINIPGGHVEHGDEVVPYLAVGESKEQYVFVYRQFYNITDVPMIQYTTTECRAENRCGFAQPRFVWDFDLQLLGAGRYDIKKDIYGELYSQRRGNQTPNQACDAYLAAKKAKEGGKESQEGGM